MATADIEVSTDHLALVQGMYEEASNSLTPTSRSMLAKHLSEKTGTPYKIALQVVDVYCEQNGVPVPDYLGREFNVGWLKVVSVLLMVIAVGACVYGRTLHTQQRNPTVVWVFAALFGGLAVLMWVKSLEAEVDNSKKEPRLDKKSL
jgi:hypothetical protein